MAPYPQVTGHCPTSRFHVDVSWHKSQALVTQLLAKMVALFWGFHWLDLYPPPECQWAPVFLIRNPQKMLKNAAVTVRVGFHSNPLVTCCEITWFYVKAGGSNPGILAISLHGSPQRTIEHSGTFTTSTSKAPFFIHDLTGFGGPLGISMSQFGILNPWVTNSKGITVAYTEITVV